jgi:hypothetical protein
VTTRVCRLARDVVRFGILSPRRSMNVLWIFSGVFAATSSMSMPPSLEAIRHTRCVPRSTTMPT